MFDDDDQISYHLLQDITFTQSGVDYCFAIILPLVRDTLHLYRDPLIGYRFCD